MRTAIRLLVLSSLPLLPLAACGGTAPPSSLAAGRLLPCPPRPHCVSTASTEPDDRRMSPIPFTDSPATARARVLAAIRAEPRAVIVDEEGPYIRAAVPTRIFRFVDDVELLVDSATRRIGFRSSARLGYNDWGVNRARMERLQARLRM